MEREDNEKERPATNDALKKIFFVFIFLISLSIFFIEFFFDLTREIALNRLVIVLDIIILVIYFSLVFNRIYRKRTRILDMMSSERSDIAYLLLILSFLFMPRLAAGLVILRFLIAAFMCVLETELGARFSAALNLRPSQTLALSFVGLIAMGTVLLTFPAAT